MNTIWGVLSIVAEFISVVLLVSLFVPGFRENALVRFFANNAILVAFVVSGLAMAGSLTYSEVIGYSPCVLCWYQRILMYPQALLMGIALGRKDRSIKLYGLVMSIVGGVIAAYHYIGQLGGTPLPCSAVGVSVSCAQKFTLEFGYITIPMMAFSAFALIATALAVSIVKDRSASAA
ncbi:MAG TPA: disulfide bond formation protein B [Candidatus Paceibacterota bacterium]|nr:disulfide bond formation protein B [Candidatus Paceibacterota bacterium]